MSMLNTTLSYYCEVLYYIHQTFLTKIALTHVLNCARGMKYGLRRTLPKKYDYSLEDMIDGSALIPRASI